MISSTELVHVLHTEKQTYDDQELVTCSAGAMTTTATTTAAAAAVHEREREKNNKET